MTLTSTIRKIESELKKAEKLARHYGTHANVLRNKLAPIAQLFGEKVADFIAPDKPGKRKRKFSASHRAKIAKAQKARWAKHHEKEGKKVGRGRRKGWKLSATQKASISRAKKIWWAARKKKK